MAFIHPQGFREIDKPAIKSLLSIMNIDADLLAYFKSVCIEQAEDYERRYVRKWNERNSW
jgi:hypothetical protein